MLDKKLILDQLIENLEADLSAITVAAKTSHDYVTSGDVKSDGKYDTRAIEAAYLAGAQEKRVEEIKLDLQMLKDLELGSSPTIQLGSLAQIKYKNSFIILYNVAL
jgi:hypothetical protein